MPVIRRFQRKDGQRYVVVEHPLGRIVQLPIDWTDQSTQTMPYSIDGCENARLSITGLSKLAAAIRVVSVQKAMLKDIDTVLIPTSAADVPTIKQEQTVLAITPSNRATQCPGRLGDVGSQNPVCRIKGEGEEP